MLVIRVQAEGCIMEQPELGIFLLQEVSNVLALGRLCRWVGLGHQVPSQSLLEVVATFWLLALGLLCI